MKNLVKNIRKYQKLTIIEPSDVIPLLGQAADRIEKLEEALEYIAKCGRPAGIVDEVAKEALSNKPVNWDR